MAISARNKRKKMSEQEIEDYIDSVIDSENAYAYPADYGRNVPRKINTCPKCKNKVVVESFVTKDRKTYRLVLNVFDKADRWMPTDIEKRSAEYERTIRIDNRYAFYQKSEHTKEICENLRKKG